MTAGERDPYLCAAGSFFFPGLGQVYCGRILRGIVFLIPAVLLTIPHGFFYLVFRLDPIAGSWFAYWSSLASVISKITDFIVRVVATYDAYKIAKLTESLTV